MTYTRYTSVQILHHERQREWKEVDNWARITSMKNKGKENMLENKTNIKSPVTLVIGQATLANIIYCAFTIGPQ